MVKQRVLSVSAVLFQWQKSQPPQLIITAAGIIGSANWHCPELRAVGTILSEGRILDLELVAEPPTGITIPVTLPIVASVLVTGVDVRDIEAVRVYAASNSVTKPINQLEVPPPHPMGPGDWYPWQKLFGHSVGNG